jgi:hypothetical protein
MLDQGSHVAGESTHPLLEAGRLVTQVGDEAVAAFLHVLDQLLG